MADGPDAAYAPIIVLGLTLFGAAFSVYLTTLELAVIEAVCIWCLGVSADLSHSCCSASARPCSVEIESPETLEEA